MTKESVKVRFPRHAPKHGEDWIIDPAFLLRVYHSINPDTNYGFIPSMEEIETALLALEVIPSDLYTAPPQQPEQEPVWCGCGDEIVAGTGARCGTCVGIRDMRVWRGLSYEEFTAVRRASQFRDVSESSCKKFYRAIEAKLREKNTT